ncbi:putative pyridoxal reductase [[Candida] jaroonii]|uniref:Pyridoxal reductase n=1 Tax=[Candida] jaroonii TaxID=467808 RepID=A0ACA9Y3Y0_9ASCO|nr:putative pyridoxal reductase [[Candida] jaroonii]
MSINIGKKGFGTMSMTWTVHPQPLAESIKTLQHVRTKYGVKFFNGSTFYHVGPERLNLKLLREFAIAAKDPELIFSIKGGTSREDFRKPATDKQGIEDDMQLLDEFFGDLNPKPKLIYQVSRVGPLPYDQTIGYIQEHVKTGRIDGISISEVGVESIKKAVSVAPISCVEVEVSLFSQDIIENGILAEAAKHGITIVPYSPLCRGILTDHAVETDFLNNIPEGDIRSFIKLDKFQPENFEKNKVCLDKLYDYAHKKKNTTLESLALSYLNGLSGLKEFEGIKNLPQFVPIPSGKSIERVDQNYSNLIDLSPEDISEIQTILKENKVVGSRYNAQMERTLNG